MRDFPEPARDFGDAARRQDQRIAAGDDDLADGVVCADVVDRRIETGTAGQRLFATRSDHLAAEAEPAVDRAGVRRLQQHPVGVAVHDPRHRRMGIIADRIGKLLGAGLQLAGIGDELARDRVGGIDAVDQARHRRRDRDGIARRDLGGGIQTICSDQPRIEQVFRRPQRSTHGASHGTATGAQSTCSIDGAPVASITRRSKPSAIPDAGGISASAARKSSSIG